MNRRGNLPEASAARSPPATLGEALAEAEHTLGAQRRDAPLLLAHVLGCPRSHLLAHPEAALDPVAGARYAGLIARRAAGEPAAYLIGEREFWSLSLAVSPAVLVPRPETELLVERALALHGSGVADVVDLGTGSGAVALALARERPAWRLSGLDRSPDALAVARANGRRLALDVEWLEGDWFAPLAGRRFDLIVSNPPYVASGDPALAALAYEPAQALTPGPTGLEALAHLVRGASAHLRPGGWLVLEHGAEQADALAELLRAAAAACVRGHRDLAGLPRVTEAQWTGPLEPTARQ